MTLTTTFAPAPTGELQAAYGGATALVAGGSAGIGQAILGRLRDLGAQTACLDLRPPHDEGHRFLSADVSDSQALDAAIGELVGAFGRLDHLFCCYPLPDLYPAESIFHLLGATAPYLRDARGAIVFVGARTPAPRDRARRSPGLTEVLSKELGYFGIRVNAVSHGPFDGAAPIRPEDADRDCADVFLGAGGDDDEPGEEGRGARSGGVAPACALHAPLAFEDVANAALFLASPFASKVTGQVLWVGGEAPP